MFIARHLDISELAVQKNQLTARVKFSRRFGFKRRRSAKLDVNDIHRA